MQNSSVKPKSDLLRLSVTLFLIAGIMALVISLVNGITAPVIEQRAQQKIDSALKEIIPEADSFSEYSYNRDSLMSADGKEIGIDGVWLAKSGEKTIGCCVKVSPKGYGGKIETLVSVGIDGKIIDTQIVSLSETSGIGTKIQSESFLSKVNGRTGSVFSSVEVISGATKSSKAYLRGVDAALIVADDCIGGEMD